MAKVFGLVKQVPPNRFVEPTDRILWSSTFEPKFLIYDQRCLHIFGSEPKIILSLEAPEPIFHEACVFIQGDISDAVFVTSNAVYPSSGVQPIQISKLKRNKNDSQEWSREIVPTKDAVMSNGAVNHPPTGGVLFCSQGDKSVPSRLILMDADPPYSTHIVLSHFHGRQFNSVNDVVPAKDGSIWFTDPTYGFMQGFRPSPELPNQLYRYDPTSGNLRAVADGLKMPNGLCFSPDEMTMYVTDTAWISGDGTTDDSTASHIYAFSVEYYAGAPFLTNRRLFAMADCGAPDGIKCDMEGNVYSGCGDGVQIWAPDGCLLGKIMISGGVANFCFGRPGELFLLNETKFWTINIAKHVRGALLGLSS